MISNKEYIEIELVVSGHRYKKKEYKKRVGFVSLKQHFGNGYIMHYFTDYNCGKPVWLKEIDIDRLYRLKAGVIELKPDGTYTITQSINPFLYLERRIRNLVGIDRRLSLKNILSRK